ncbi:unnamed protein product [Protopolystoma xenopodis]|uniref:Uncharacterized protein n=1 Tax=Protopolystoma xenopodis TaxID=117903 RepID=A0A3S5FDJ3_9PLAT|nr:unnamed protein product [Protopolystoma xenopodis]
MSETPTECRFTESGTTPPEADPTQVSAFQAAPSSEAALPTAVVTVAVAVAVGVDVAVDVDVRVDVVCVSGRETSGGLPDLTPRPPRRSVPTFDAPVGGLRPSLKTARGGGANPTKADRPSRQVAEAPVRG